MTRILVQRGSSSSSANQSRATPTQQFVALQIPSVAKQEEHEEEVLETGDVDLVTESGGGGDERTIKNDEVPRESNEQEISSCEIGNKEESSQNISESGILTRELNGLQISERLAADDCGSSSSGVLPMITGSSYPPPPPVPPPKPSTANLSSRRNASSCLNTMRGGSSRRSVVARPVVSARTSPSGSRPSSPRSYGEAEGYNSADEQGPCFGPSFDDLEREQQFELDIRRTKGFEVKRMLEDGNCLFRAVADQVYGDSEAYDLARQMCIDYMERERDHFSQFVTEGFTSYCKRKRRDKVYGNNAEIQALSEMYNRPIHIYSYSTEPINIFHGNYNTDTPPVRLSYHHGNHYNSLVDPRRLAIGAGLGFSSLQGANVDKDQVKAAIRAQQEQQIDNALLAEGRFYSDLELTEKEIERMVMEVSRAEYLAKENFKRQHGSRESTSSAESSSSGTRALSADSRIGGASQRVLPDTVLSRSMQMVLSMGFNYLQVLEAYNIFGDDMDSVVCYLLETGSGRLKGKATE
ncbi:hypothetical protein Sjap_001093 [Stephania japonica]|uniref:OTU domain-containing protein 5 n=1 Tax=Stephania japonica TaxID=461633 RepID=A0AAP0KJB7_9MAGN